MKTKCEEKLKSFKSCLSEHLSNTITALHQECTLSKSIDASVAPDSDVAGHLTAVLEAAFIHGLKETYYDKHKRSRELPKPQFWDLIRKISHKDTLMQVHKLSYIRSRVGQCRAWLRLALNESALSSYLSSLLHTTEYKSLVCRFYDSYALFRDHEQCDIFLRYLQGIENLSFNLSCNSSVLNSWTRTPLELAGIIASSKKRPSLQNAFSPRNKSSGLTHSSSWNQLQLSSSGSHSLPSLTNSVQVPLSSSPALSFSSHMSGSYTSVHVFPLSEVGNLVEVHPDAGQADLPMDVDGNLRSSDAVLHRRFVARKRSKRRKKQINDDILSSGSRSRCSSISSLSSITSNGNLLFLRDEHPANDVSAYRTGSVSSGEGNCMSCAPVALLPGSVQNVKSDKCNLSSQETSNQYSCVPSFCNESEAINNPSTRRYDDNRTDDASTKTEETIVSVDKEDLNEISGHAVQSPSEQQLLPENKEVVDEEEINIYDLQSSFSSTSHLDTIEESFTEPPTTPMSPGYGNSLRCNVGWSSDNSPNTEAKKDLFAAADASLPTQNFIASPKLDKKEKTSISSAVFGRKEGYLKKKGEFLFSRERWFVLTAETLSYYKDKSSKEEIGVFPLVGVRSIDDGDIEKTKSICIKMADGVEHCLTAERSLIAEWAKDIRRAVKEAQVDTSAYNIDSVENTYEVVEAFDANRDGQSKTSDVTSWFSSMKDHMTKIANEKGLDAQNYQCTDCASPIGMIYGNPRVCSFTGKYYCNHCHDNGEHIIPARIIHNWDFRKHKVSKRSKKFLLDMWKEPCIDMNRVNPVAYRHLAELQKILPLRLKLTALHPYISTCRLIPVGEFDSKLRGHFYMVENPHLYSAHDLHKTLNNSLYDVINKAVTSGINHVLSCQLCCSKGFICEVCRSDEVIFPFQNEKISQCEECKSVYHKTCLPDLSKCRKCERRNRRLKAEATAIIGEEHEIQSEA